MRIAFYIKLRHLTKASYLAYALDFKRHNLGIRSRVIDITLAKVKHIII
jgi:hypothetical protein